MSFSFALAQQVSGSPAAMVLAFRRKFGYHVACFGPEFNMLVAKSQLLLLEEELKEYKAAVANEDLVEVADALTDLAYVLHGTFLALGIPFDACFTEVHRSNMTKGQADPSNPLKPTKTHFSPPDLKAILTEALMRAHEHECNTSDSVEEENAQLRAEVKRLQDELANVR